MGKSIPACRVGTSNTALELIGWLRVLPPSYEATWSRTSKGAFTDLMHISVRRATLSGGTGLIPLFCLRFEPTFRQFELRIDRNSKLCFLADLTTRVYFKPGPDYDYVCEYSIERTGTPGPEHPWSVLSARLEDHHRTNPSSVPAAVRVVVNANLAQAYAALEGEPLARKTFTALLAVITGGVVHTVRVTKENAVDKMEAVDGGYLYSVYCIFPWVIDLLLKEPKCAMTDSTFKAVKPYTLAILHLIFANESLPIGFALSPSETAQSYIGLYSMILDQLRAFHSNGQPAGAGFLLGLLASSSRPGTSQNNWPENPNEEEEVLELQSTPDQADTDEDRLDFEISALSCVDKAIVELPDVPDSPPPRQTTGEAPWSRCLLDLPIITDQGAALRAFVARFNLKWKLCHRHIIEAIGAKGRLANWVVRILQCFSRREFIRVRKTIVQEMYNIRSTLDESNNAYISVLQLLGLRPGDGHPYCDIYCWALWLRLGCPRTTNSAESVNGRLNAEIKKDETWLQRVLSVAQHLKKRYETREQWRDRSLKRNIKKCYPEDISNESPESSARRIYYLHLHDAFDKSLSRRKNEKFLPEVPARFLMAAAYSSEYTTRPRLPESWQVQGDIGRNKGQTPVGEATGKLEIDESSARTVFGRIAWQITWAMSKELGPKSWNRCGQTVNDGVITIGRAMHLGDDKVTSRQEADWRSKCWQKLSEWAAK
jgi:hypothetical protein